jgi:RNA polymerase sigma-70 factor (ECF subfamily)
MTVDDVTRALADLSRGDPEAADRLLPIVYREMKSLAAAYLRRERAGHTLQPTALAHDAFLRLVSQKSCTWQNRAHFLGMAARVMRHILVDHARRRRAQRRGGGRTMVQLEEAQPGRTREVEFDELDQALNDLARLSERQARMVELRYFGGLTIDETAEVLGVSPMTVKRDWTVARAWLFRELRGTTGPGAG